MTKITLYGLELSHCNNPSCEVHHADDKAYKTEFVIDRSVLGGIARMALIKSETGTAAIAIDVTSQITIARYVLMNKEVLSGVVTCDGLQWAPLNTGKMDLTTYLLIDELGILSFEVRLKTSDGVIDTITIGYLPEILTVISEGATVYPLPTATVTCIDHKSNTSTLF